jgi:exonuclease III
VVYTRTLKVLGLVFICSVDSLLFYPMDPSKILFWNVRGLNSSVRQHVVRVLVDSAKIDVVCCKETKMQFISRRDMLSMLGVEFTEFVFLPSMGNSGGILVAWKRNIGHTGLQRIDSHSVSVQFCRQDGQPWWLTCVYGPRGMLIKLFFSKS